MVQWLVLHASTAGTWVRSLVGELGPHKLCGTTKKTKTKQNKNKNTGKINFNNIFCLSQYIQNIVVSALINIKDVMNEIVDILKILNLWDFLGGPLAKTPCSQCGRPGFDPWSGN